ncbi:unnamed protein product [Schistosoma curassoni]|uniref:Reverse transcriptase domain-containing protein n=1 Tax=Schistosoma curassoni TaxID=6186 RepID=A0A183K1X2_9TREM|nr:unnamed protein product [Schistosoma curassoni]
MEEPATTVKKAAREEKNQTTGKYSKPERSVRDENVKTITEIQEQRSRWVEYFDELLNRPAPLNPSDTEAAPTAVL